jgi:hypothetical protein
MFVVISAVAVVIGVGVAVARWYTAPRALNLRRERSIAVLLLAVPVVLLTQSRGIGAGEAEIGLAACVLAAVIGFGVGQVLRSSIELAQDGGTTFVRGGAPYFALAITASCLRVVLSYVFTGSLIPTTGSNVALAMVVTSAIFSVVAGAWAARAVYVGSRSRGLQPEVSR